MLAKRHFLLFSLLLAALILSGWSFFIMYSKRPASALDDANRPDAYMEDVIATVIDDQGKPALKIISPKMTHFVENDRTEIIKPLLTLYRTHQKNNKPWHLTANHAKTLQGINQILLWDNVIINHPGDDLDEKTLLMTPTLTVYPEKQLAETPDPVVISQPNTKIYAVGMNADLASGAVKLLSQTRGEYSVQN